MQKINYTANTIMQEYKLKKKYEEKADLMKFKRQVCNSCKNKYSNKCHITKDIDNKLKCAFYEN